ncbi:MAG: ABC transporter substrate-binding protein [Ferruginibacter sp.]|nr:ABC transporter substrate-binding protein [Ferruginibacter sp.]
MILLQPTDLPCLPKRIISLVPSQTELLYDLGLETETVGITKFCVHPQSWFKTKQRVGGTKTINLAKVKELIPDLIIANKEENVKEQVEELAQHYPVWLTDVNDLGDAIQMIEDIGALTGKQTEAKNLAISIKESFGALEKHPTQNYKLKTAYLIWQKPYMAVGGDTFVNSMMQHCGFENIFTGKKRYPEISIAQLQAANCQLLLLSSEPYPFKQKHIEELSKQLPGTKIILADGEYFSWYGSRLLKSPGYFKKLIESIG